MAVTSDVAAPGILAHRYEKVPYAAFALLVAGELTAILTLNHGMFIYTLDDAYIHLALARRIWTGVYGINAHELAAPASSILWPFVLAPFSALPTFVFALVPWLLNVVLASTTLVLLIREVRRALAPGPYQCLGAPVAAFAVGLVLGTNLVPLVFTGMEHSLQQLLALLIVAGLLEEGKTARVPATLWISLLLIPLVRYDSLALAVPSLIYLLWRGHVRGALVVALMLGGGLIGFSSFLVTHGLGLLPASVMAKSQVLQAGGAPAALLLNLYSNLVLDSQGNILLFGLALTLAGAFDRRRPAPERGLAGVLATAMGLEILFGKLGAYFRYEDYIWTGDLLALTYLYRATLSRWLLASTEPAARIAVLGVLGAASLGYLYALVSTPLAANNIYDQQYQMHRFVTDYYHGPVAVNDLGWVAFDNTSYVLDLAGLASREALLSRQTDPSSRWINRLCLAHEVRLVMIYDEWFPSRPSQWVHVGTLKLSRFRITPASNKVEFYATDRPSAAAIYPLLARFQTSLPEGAHFQLDEMTP